MRKRTMTLLLSGLILVSGTAWLPAQRIEIHPYAGGMLIPGSVPFGNGQFELRQQAMYGVRTDFFVGRHFEFGGNFAYLDDIKFKGTNPDTQAYLWEANGSYRFDLEGFKPFLMAGIGGLTVDNNSVQIANQPFVDGNYLTFSYGGGLKAPRLWGPMGLRGDIRGRTLPNFVGGDATTWLELTGGLTFTF